MNEWIGLDWKNCVQLYSNKKEKSFQDWCIKNEKEIFSNPFDEYFEKKSEKMYISVKKGNVSYYIEKKKDEKIYKANDDDPLLLSLKHKCNEEGNRCTFARFENIFICKYSRNVHICTKEKCDLKKKTDVDNYYICSVSGYVTVNLIYGFNTLREEDETGMDVIHENKKKKTNCCNNNEGFSFFKIWEYIQEKILNPFVNNFFFYKDINNNLLLLSSPYYLCINIEEYIYNYKKNIYDTIKNIIIKGINLYNNNQNICNDYDKKKINCLHFVIAYLLYFIEKNKKNEYFFVCFIEFMVEQLKNKLFDKKNYDIIFFLKNKILFNSFL